MEEDKADQLATFLNAAMGYLKDPKASVPAIVQAMQEMATDANNELNGLNTSDVEISDVDTLKVEVFIDFLSRHNPNGLSKEDIEEQINAIIAMNHIDGHVSPQEMLGGLVIAGGIIDDNFYMSAESFQMAAEILEEIGMPEQTDIYGTTLAHYLNAAKNDMQIFVNSFLSKPEQPSMLNNNNGGQGISYKQPSAGQSN